MENTNNNNEDDEEDINDRCLRCGQWAVVGSDYCSSCGKIIGEQYDEAMEASWLEDEANRAEYEAQIKEAEEAEAKKSRTEEVK